MVEEQEGRALPASLVVHRDLIAALAMMGILSGHIATMSLTAGTVAELAYEVADSMLAVRERRAP